MKLSFLKEVELKEKTIIPTNKITVFPLFFVSSEMSEMVLLLVEI